MKINFYDKNDEKLGQINFLGFDRWEEPGFDSEDFNQKQVDFLASLPKVQKINLDSVEWVTVNLSESEKIQLIQLN